ncbi:MAG: GNAT family protein [Ilumatobacteraceae bacterium]
MQHETISSGERSTCCNVGVISLPLTTERLAIKMMRPLHVASFVQYRNHPDVARYQDWSVPFTVDMAERVIAEQSTLNGPTGDDWVQLAIELREGAPIGAAIGDVAVGIHDSDRQASIGYSIAPAHQGMGYATEAVTAVIDALFGDAGVHRITAGIDPQNVASRRVLDKLGFHFEGRSPLSVFVRGEWVDDDRFALLAGECSGNVTPADDRA